MGTFLGEADNSPKCNSRTESATQPVQFTSVWWYLPQHLPTLEGSRRTFRNRRCVAACRFRSVCVRHVRPGALLGTRLCPSPRVLRSRHSGGSYSRSEGTGRLASHGIFRQSTCRAGNEVKRLFCAFSLD